jgi:hypothetical protein
VSGRAGAARCRRRRAPCHPGPSRRARGTERRRAASRATTNSWALAEHATHGVSSVRRENAAGTTTPPTNDGEERASVRQAFGIERGPSATRPGRPPDRRAMLGRRSRRECGDAEHVRGSSFVVSRRARSSRRFMRRLPPIEQRDRAARAPSSPTPTCPASRLLRAPGELFGEGHDDAKARKPLRSPRQALSAQRSRAYRLRTSSGDAMSVVAVMEQHPQSEINEITPCRNATTTGEREPRHRPGRAENRRGASSNHARSV